MGATITLFEYECTFGGTDKDFAALERLNRTAGVKMLRPVIRRGKRAIRATQHVGVFRLGNRTIQVLPKIYQSNENKDERQRARAATRNLLQLLQIAGDVKIREQEFASLLSLDMDWFEILTHLFAKHLREEWQRGASRSYVLVEDDLPALKGKWRIAEQLRHPGRDHLLAVAYDEFTADIPLNRVFRFVVERLWSITRDSKNRQMLGELRQWLDEVTLLPSMHVGDAGPTLLNRLNRRWEPLLNLARMFLDRDVLQMAVGNLSSFAFVFDMNQVFERFVVNFIRKHRQRILPPEMWDCDLLPQARNVSRCLARLGDKPVFRLKPDLVVRNGGTFALLVDTKYKKLKSEEPGDVVAQDDFYQMFAYAHRYDCPRILMLYPQTADMPTAFYQEYALKGTVGKTVAVATIDIRQDLSKAEGRSRLVDELKAVMKTGELYDE